ncbi:GntR family transcriptional regulator [Rhizobium calliandrae]|uniref:GntR family transcriptional regulator n=1 Tax=Rhizobium calliandrae TaxID=1312182 RepID=A0ABT7KKV2_9HYPH|nr:GntR family transcriptional regulator [Rhizobium calliandrae]MDL2408588.1 GntR family transcriptional regulator [Rhizobium calliandrae]
MAEWQPQPNDERMGRDKATHAYSTIKTVLLSHRVPPSTFLNIKAIALALKLSPTPVREALTRLAHEDIVLQAPSGRGFFSRAFRIDELASEFEAARLISTYTLLEQQSQVAARQTWIFATDDIPSDPVLCRSLMVERFYLRLAELSQNFRLQRVMEGFVERSRFIRLHDLSAPGRLVAIDELLLDLKELIVADAMEVVAERLRDETRIAIEQLPDMMQQILRRAHSAALSMEAALTLTE